VLKGETQVTLGLPRELARVEAKTRSKRAASGGGHGALFDRLRTVRKQLADDAGVPPFVVFSDATLVEMARYKPRNDQELLAITGVGEHKLHKYGSFFLAALAEPDSNQ